MGYLIARKNSLLEHIEYSVLDLRKMMERKREKERKRREDVCETTRAKSHVLDLEDLSKRKYILLRRDSRSLFLRNNYFSPQ